MRPRARWTMDDGRVKPALALMALFVLLVGISIAYAGGIWGGGGSGSMTYPDAGIPQSTGSAWGDSLTLDTDCSSVSASDDSVCSAKTTKAQLDLKAASSHAHAGTDITSGTIAGDYLPAMSETKKGGVPATGTPSGKFLRDDATFQTPTTGAGGSDTQVQYSNAGALAGITGLVSNGSIVYKALAAFTDADATPSVAGGHYFKTANTGSTTITAFDGGTEGQVIWVLVADNNTVFDFTSTTLVRPEGTDYTAATGDLLMCINNGTNWYCQVTGVNCAANNCYIGLPDNAGGRAPTAASYEIYFDAGVLKVNENGTEKTVRKSTDVERLATFAWDGGGSAVTAGATSKRCTTIPHAGEITGWTLTNQQADTVSIHVYKDAYSADAVATTSITDSHDPATSSKVAATDSDLSDWTAGRTVTANDSICAEVHEATAATWINLVIWGTR